MDESEIWTLFDDIKCKGDERCPVLESQDKSADKDCVNECYEAMACVKKKKNQPRFKKPVQKFLKKEDDHGNCEFCKGTSIFLIDGNYTCQTCNAILSKYIDPHAEWRTNGGDDNKKVDKTRCGMPVNEFMPEFSLSTCIGFGQGKESHDIRMMRRYHSWNNTCYRERSLYEIFELLTINSVINGLNKMIIDEAKTLYKNFCDIKIGRNDNKKALVASCIYVACKLNKVPRSPKEIAQIFNLPASSITKCQKRLQEVMHIDVKCSTAADFIGRYCSHLSLDQEFQNLCKDVVHIVEHMDLASENTPPSTAVSVICFCMSLCHIKRDKNDIVKKCDTSQITINKCVKRFEENKDTIIQNMREKSLI